MDLGIRGKRALVTAGSKGLGRGCAQALAEAGVDLVLNARGADALEATAAELRAEFDLSDRYQALELKLRSVQEALELVLEVARDRRLVLLEGAIVLLIVFEIVLALVS